MDRSQPDDCLVGGNLEPGAKVRRHPAGRRRLSRHADVVGAVRDTLEQEKAVEVGSHGRDDLSGRINELEIKAFEAEAAALDYGSLDVPAADEPDLHFGGNSRARHDHLEGLPRHQHRIGEARFVDADRDWIVNGQLVFSEVAGDPAAIEHLQLAPQRYLQRTATPHVSFDPSRTSMRGWNGHVNFNRNQGAWTANASVWAVSPGFESSDMGFHYDGDRWGNHLVLTWKQIEPDRISQDRNIMVGKFYVWNFDHTKLSDGVMAFPRITFLNYWNMQGSVGWFRQGQDDRLTRGGPPSLSLPSRSASLTVNSDSRKRIVLHVNGGREWGESGADQGNGGVTIDWKPSSRVSLSSGPAYTHNVTPGQYVTTTDDPTAIATGGKRYVFARLEQKQLSIDTRLNVLFSAKASLQMFIQPLVVVGDYMDFKSLAIPRTFDFDPYSSLAADPSFNFKSLRANAIFRWEWRLGSTLYVAWTQQRQDLSDPGTFDVGRDVRGVFTGPADNIFMIKISRWFGR